MPARRPGPHAAAVRLGDPYDGRMSESRAIGLAGATGAFLLDAALVVVFATIGRGSHAEGLDVTGIWGTAWPFVAGLALGWLAALAWRTPLAVWPTGVVVWAGALVGGMLLRVATGDGAAPAFVIVAALTLALLLLGWRVVAQLLLRLRSRQHRPVEADAQ